MKINRFTKILRQVGLFFVLVLLASSLENNIWIGQLCDSSSANNICDKKVADSHRSFHLGLESCKSALKARDHDFICASGPDANKPDVTMEESFREVYFSGNDSIQSRDVKWSFTLLPFEIMAAILVVICIELGTVIFQKIRKT